MRIILCIDGPDGSGKTYWAEHSGPKYRYIHMIPFSRRWSVRKTFVGGLFAEFIMGAERFINSWGARILARWNSVIMDRCFIAGEVYASFWDQRFGTRWFSRICRFWNLAIYKPKSILIFVPSPGKARPRKAYSDKEIQDLSHRYPLMLSRYGYKVKDEVEYNFGVVQTWRK
jgi:thymidylate kinase